MPRRCVWSLSEHHLAHGRPRLPLLPVFQGKDRGASLGIDGKGEYATTFSAMAERQESHKIQGVLRPGLPRWPVRRADRVPGFEMLDGEFKVMGMAPTRRRQVRFLAAAKFENGRADINTDICQR